MNPFQARAFHAAALVISYIMAILFFPGVSEGLRPKAYFAETYFGCIGFSIFLSVAILFFRPGLPLYLALALRCYVLIILGYSVGGTMSAKLALGAGMTVETACLLAWPRSLAMAGGQLAAFVAAQAWPRFFGTSGIAEGSIRPRADELAALAAVMVLAGFASALIKRLLERVNESRKSLRLQEATMDALAELNLNLQGYARTVDEESSERERNRISREIHDISGYIFTNIIALMDAAGSIPRGEQAALSDVLITARRQAQEGLRETRTALRRLRDEKPERANAHRAIYKVVSIFRKIAGIEVELSLGELPQSLPKALSMALYRTVQEALTNAIRHGKATRVRVDFQVDGSDVLLVISDNGKGATEVVKGIGLRGMEERVGGLGGRVSAGAVAEGGFAVRVRVPISRDEDPARDGPVSAEATAERAGATADTSAGNASGI